MASNAKQLKSRIRSVDSTMHITKAMELVASSKLRRATARMEAARPYFSAMTSAMSKLARADSVYSTAREVKKTCFVVVAGDRGLAATTRAGKKISMGNFALFDGVFEGGRNLILTNDVF